jgi:hypothetical protein
VATVTGTADGIDCGFGCTGAASVAVTSINSLSLVIDPAPQAAYRI